MKFLDFSFVWFLLYFNFLVILFHNLWINKCNIWLLSSRGRSPEKCLPSPPPHFSVSHTLYCTHQVFSVPWTQLASLYFRASVYVASFSWGVFIKVLFMHKGQNVTSFCKVFALPIWEGKCGFHNTVPMCLLCFYPLWYICEFPTPYSSLRAEARIIFISQCLAQGLLLEEETLVFLPQKYE